MAAALFLVAGVLSSREGLQDPVRNKTEFPTVSLSSEVALGLLCGQLFHQRGQPQLQPGTSLLFPDSLENTVHGLLWAMGFLQREERLL